MALVNRTFMLDITPGAIPKVVNVSEYDQNRQFTVSLVDEGGVFEIPSGTTAKVEGSIGGNAFSESATVSGNTITFTLSESMTAAAGDAWCKIKLTKDSKPIQTCAFILRCDRAGVEAGAVIGAPGFEEQINEGIAEYFDNDPPFFELPSGGQSGQALLSDGNNGAYWGQAQSGGTGLSDDAKAALLACFRNVAWIGSDGQDYYDDLYDALYPPATLLSISAVFNQGGHAIYDTDTLDSLKQYLTVTAHYDNGTSQTVTNYTLSGTLMEGTSTVTVLYNGKTTTFNVTVTERPVICNLTGEDFLYQKQLTDTSPYYANSSLNYHRTSYVAFDIPIHAGNIKFELNANTNDITFGAVCISSKGAEKVTNNQSISENGKSFARLSDGSVIEMPTTFDDGFEPAFMRFTLTTIDFKNAIPLSDIIRLRAYYVD